MISGYNLVVDSNVSTPNSSAPRAAFLSAKFWNDGATAITNLNACIGNFTNNTPGVFPVRAHPPLAGTFSLSPVGGAAGVADAARYLPRIEPGSYVAVYWLVTYPVLDSAGTPVTGGSKPDDDLWMNFDIWATAQEGSTMRTAAVRRTVTTRSMISAMANKIFPNSANKVPQEYQDLMNKYAPAWTNSPEDGSPGTTILTEGVWYDLGNVSGGYDGDGDLVPDQNAWLQPVGDAASFDPTSFRLERTYAFIVVKLKTGGEQVLVVDDKLYFDNLPENNGVVGWVGYEFRALRSGGSAQLSPYQSAASGRLNEKFNGDYGATLGSPIESAPSAVEMDNTVDKSTASPGDALTYTISFTNSGAISLGNPDLGLPLVVNAMVPTGTAYVAGSAAAGLTLPVGVAGCTIMYSTNNGLSWLAAEPAAAAQVTHIQWWLSDPLQAAAFGAVTFQSTVANPYLLASPTLTESAGLSFGNSAWFLQEYALTDLLGQNVAQGIVFRDDGAGGGILGNRIQDGGEWGITNVGVSLYYDSNASGAQDAGDALRAATNSGANGAYAFTNLFDGRYIVVVDSASSNIPGGYGLTTKGSGALDLDAARVIGSPVTGTVHFGFAPALAVTKTFTGTPPLRENNTVAYRIVVTNMLPGNALPPGGVYTNWSRTNSGAIGTGWTEYTNAWQPPSPDGRYAKAAFGSAPSDDLPLFGYTNTGSGTITNVYLVAVVVTQGAFRVGVSPDLVTFAVAISNTTIFAYTNRTASYTNGTMEFNLSSLRTWQWTDFPTAKVTVTATKGGGGTGGGTFMLDAAGFRILTAATSSGPPTNGMTTVPLRDYFRTNLVDFVSAAPPPTSITTNGALGTLYWDNVGPVYGGSAAVVTVTFRLREPAGNAATTLTNIAAVAGAVFDSGLPVNSSTTTATTAVSPAGAIGSYVWGDLNANGVRDAWETGFGGVAMVLWPPTGVDLGSGAGNPVTNVTDGDGYYYFYGIPASGAYTVTVTTATLPGGAGTQTYDPDGSLNNRANVALVYDAASPDNHSFTNRFGYIPAASTVDGYLWHDLNRDASTNWTAGDDWLSGVTMYLCRGPASCGAGTALATNTTTAGGYYKFTGSYTGALVVTVGTNTGSMAGGGWVPSYNSSGTSTPNYASITVVSGGTSRASFSYYKTGTNSIGNLVFLDRSSNGVFNAGFDAGLAGVTVRLYEDANGDGNVNAADDGLMGTVTTAADGTYTFSNLPRTNYIIIVDGTSPGLPEQYLITADPYGLKDGKSALSITTTNRMDQNFGYYAYGSGAISSYAWHDVNGDGIKSGVTETGLVGVAVVLMADFNDNGNWVVITTNYTAAGGAYSFSGLPDGKYWVGVVGTNGIPADNYGLKFVPTTPTNYVVIISGGATNTASKFGYTALGSIGNLIFWDANKSGAHDITEPGVTGAVVNLYFDVNGNRVYDPGLDILYDSKTTASNGLFTFYGLPPTNYVIVVDTNGVLLGAAISADPNADGVPCDQGGLGCDGQYGMTISAGQNFMGADFGYAARGVIGQSLWQDANGNGVRDATEYGIPYVTMELRTNGTVVGTAVTDADGYYTFANVADGRYTIAVKTNSVDFPAGMTQTYDPDGSLDSRVTNVVLSGGVVTNIGGSGCTDCDLLLNFGYRYAGANNLSGSVILEGGGSHGPATAPFVGVPVYAYLWLDNGDLIPSASELTLITTTVTTNDGGYAFTGLPNSASSNLYLVSLSAPEPNLRLTTTTNTSPVAVVSNTVNALGDTVAAFQGARVAADITGVLFSFVSTVQQDFGDAPQTYSTKLDNTPDGARHAIKTGTNLFLGGWVRSEIDGIASANALGDGDEEDGVAVAGGWANGTNGGLVRYTVGGSVAGWLVGFVDFNTNGNFRDAGELVISRAVSAGTYTQAFTVATNAFAADRGTALFARFRLFGSQPSYPDLAYSGTADNGEVEDYLLEFSSIASYLWNDRNRDGVRDPDEPPVTDARVFVDLNGDYTWQTNEPTQWSGTNGFYGLSGVPTGSYHVVVDTNTLPAGILPTYDHDGTNTPNRAAIVVSNATVYTDYNFGYAGDAAVGGGAWLDLNANGYRDPGEPGFGTLPVVLYNSQTSYVLGAATDLDGSYAFTNVIPGGFLIGFDLPEGYEFSPRRVGGEGEAASNSAPYTASGLTAPFTLVAGQSNWNYSAGLILLATQAVDVAMAKIASHASVKVGQTFTYTLMVTNYGPGLATMITVTDAVPAGLTFLGASSGHYNTNYNTWTIGALTNTAVTSLTLSVAANAGTVGWTITNTAVATPAQPDIGPGNNTGRVTVTVGYPGMVVFTSGGVVTNTAPPDSGRGTDFGLVTNGHTKCQILSITNTGNLPLLITGWTTNGPGAAYFEVTGLPGEISVGGVSNFTICFTPLVSGVQTAKVSILNDSGTSPFEINVKGSSSPTLVVLFDFSLRVENGRVLVCWQTASETDTLGFDVYREQDGRWVKINLAFIPAKGWPNGGVGASYCVDDPGAVPGVTYRYKLVELETDGGVQEYGPFERSTWMPRLNAVMATPAGVVIQWLSRANEAYTVLKSTDLRAGYAPVAAEVPATPPVNAWTDPAAAAGAAFYRIEAR